MNNFNITIKAEQDLKQIWNYIAQDNHNAANKVLDQFFESFRNLALNPNIGHIREDLTNKPVRFWPLYSYLTIYKPDTNPITIIRVISGFRDISKLI